MRRLFAPVVRPCVATPARKAAFLLILLMSLASATGCGGAAQGELFEGPVGPPEYRLGVADVISVAVKDNPSFSAQRVVVRPDGFISLPLIDEVQVAGRTPQEVKDEVVKRLAKFIRTPLVTVTLVELRSYEFFVIGNARAPNRYSANNMVTVLQALSMAGGFNDFAEPEKITIIRRFPDGQKRLAFDYEGVVNGTRLEDNILLQSGDTVVVP